MPWTLERVDGGHVERKTLCSGTARLEVQLKSSLQRKQNVRRERASLYSLRRCLTYSLDNPLDNDQVRVDFRPLLECIHIYTTMDALEELQRSYQEDRKVLISADTFLYVFPPNVVH